MKRAMRSVERHRPHPLTHPHNSYYDNNPNLNISIHALSTRFLSDQPSLCNHHSINLSYQPTLSLTSPPLRSPLPSLQNDLPSTSTFSPAKRSKEIQELKQQLDKYWKHVNVRLDGRKVARKELRMFLRVFRGYREMPVDSFGGDNTPYQYTLQHMLKTHLSRYPTNTIT